MTFNEHANRTEKIVGIRGEDIHKWIDGFFDGESFAHFLRSGRFPDYDPYNHRKYRHCSEALEDAYQEFEGKYTRDQIKAVFECHIKDDYNGYLPHREDFENGTFTEKYHDNIEQETRETILSHAELSEYFKGKHSFQPHKKTSPISTGFLFRIVLPTIVAMILFVSAIFIIIIPVFKNNMIDRKKEMIKELTSAAASVINHYVEQAENGTLSYEIAREKAASEIEKMRYGDDLKDYFWITDMHPKMIMHPYRKELTGQDLSNYKDTEDKSGKRLFVEFVNLVKNNNEGYLEYLWQWKDDSTRTALKLSYVRGIQKWDWIIGTGIYIHDVEEEIGRLTRNLLLVFGIISLGLSLFLLNVVIQSLRIEKDRQRAETGLREAKDRYRALVEASNEGYILEVGGETIFSNLTLQRMLGYNEEELVTIKLWDLVIPNNRFNESGFEYFRNLYANKARSAEFEAQVRTKNGEMLDVLITTSKIFFSEKDGHVISFRRILHREADSMLTVHESFGIYTGNHFISKKVGDILGVSKPEKSSPISKNPSVSKNISVFEAIQEIEKLGTDNLLVKDDSGKPIGKIGYQEIAKLVTGLPAFMLSEIKNSVSVGHIILTLNKLPILIGEMINQGVKSSILRSIIGQFFDESIKKIIQISLNKFGNSPVPFAFLSLGSNARHEMALSSDQDNALVFSDVSKYEINKVRRYFLKLAEEVCAKLNQAGYTYCPGGIMAANPKWCLSISEWKKHFSDWILNPSQESIREINVFFDIHCVYGDSNLVKQLINTIIGVSEKNTNFFKKCLENFETSFWPIETAEDLKRGQKRIINIKECLTPIEGYARIYALKYKISIPGTVDRIHKLREIEKISNKTYHELIYTFEYLWKLRFRNQMKLVTEMKRLSDEFDISQLTELELAHFYDVISRMKSDFMKK